MKMILLKPCPLEIGRARGITLLPSPPPVKRGRVVVALPKPDKVRAEPAAEASYSPVVSKDTLIQAKKIAHSCFDVNDLHREFAGMISRLGKPSKNLGNLDDRFLSYVSRGFTRPFAKSESMDLSLSESALAEAKQIAPGQNMDQLAARYSAWVAKQETAPRYPDRAFIGWVKKVVTTVS